MIVKEHNIDISSLKGLDIGLMTSVLLDYMHLVCFGVGGRLIFLKIKGKVSMGSSFTNYQQLFVTIDFGGVGWNK